MGSLGPSSPAERNESIVCSIDGSFSVGVGGGGGHYVPMTPILNSKSSVSIKQQ